MFENKIEFAVASILCLSKRVHGVPLWRSGLRTWHCNCSSLGHFCGSGSIPVPGMYACCGYTKKKKMTNLYQSTKAGLRL